MEIEIILPYNCNICGTIFWALLQFTRSSKLITTVEDFRHRLSVGVMPTPDYHNTEIKVAFNINLFQDFHYKYSYLF